MIMTLRGGCAFVALAFGLTACGAVDMVSRNQPLDVPTLANPSVTEPMSFNVQDVRIVIPGNLQASERNGYYPITDIVWRGDPLGNRQAQVAALFQTAADAVQPGLTGGNTPAIATITLIRFHGLTERARYSVGGVYNMRFTLSFTDPVTGADLVPPEFIEANLAGPGGLAAVALEQNGQTEKVRVINFLTQVLGIELQGGEAV
jgi:hypothetical protein